MLKHLLLYLDKGIWRWDLGLEIDIIEYDAPFVHSQILCFLFLYLVAKNSDSRPYTGSGKCFS